jgi:Kef-type K+ transport system membrane component KefB
MDRITAPLTEALALQAFGTSDSSTPVDFLAVLGVLLFFGLLLPRLLRPLHLPFATSLILLGSLMGPHGMGWVEPESGLVLFGFLGATFHMLLAGTEAKVIGIRPRDTATWRVLAPNVLVPGLTGVLIGRIFGYGWIPSLFLGTVFLSSSIMLVFGVVGALELGRTTAGRILKRVAVVEDLMASLLAFLIFQTLAPHPRFPLPILGGLLLSSVILLRMFLPEVVAFLFAKFDEPDGADRENRLRVVIAVMLLVVFAYSALDVHPVIAAFLVGFALAEIPAAAALRERLQTIGYAIFIPVFLFVVGLETDLRVLVRMDEQELLALWVLAGGILSKALSGLLGALWAGLEAREAWFVGLASTLRLAVPLSATYAARDLGIIDVRLFSAIVILSVVTSMLGPLALPLVTGRSLGGRDD